MITNVDIQVNDNFSVAIGDRPEYEIVKNLQQTDAKFIEKSSGDAWQCIIVVPMDPGIEGYFGGRSHIRIRIIPPYWKSKKMIRIKIRFLWAFLLYSSMDTNSFRMATSLQLCRPTP
ncbi:MAG: hypothetical protein U5K51_00215 [Flavobacteriaceae bacterium]|nr:hypothetical protein [Flavobacteriaceae bacterium]